MVTLHPWDSGPHADAHAACGHVHTKIHTIMATTKKTANEIGNKNETRRELYLRKLGETFTDEAAKAIAAMKADALKENKEFQAMKAALKAKETDICESVVNRAMCTHIARTFAPLWKIETEKLLSLLVNNDGRVIRDGKPYLVGTLAQAASYAVYIHDTLHKAHKERKEEFAAVHAFVKGQRDLDFFSEEQIKANTLKKFCITEEEYNSAIETMK